MSAPEKTCQSSGQRSLHTVTALLHAIHQGSSVSPGRLQPLRSAPVGPSDLTVVEQKWIQPLVDVVAAGIASAGSNLPERMLRPITLEVRLGEGVVDVIGTSGLAILHRVGHLHGLPLLWTDEPGTQRWTIDLRLSAPGGHTDMTIDATSLPSPSPSDQRNSHQELPHIESQRRH